MRSITLIIVHCTATQEGKHYTVEDVDKWHRAKGWKMIGYHYLIYLDGSVHQGRPEAMVGAHCVNHNKHSIGVCYVGGLKASPTGGGLVGADTRTPEQKASMLKLLKELKKKYPNAVITGHNTFSSKACPCFDAASEYRKLSELKAG